MNGKFCNDLPASIWLIGYPAMKLSNYSICWKCFSVPISLLRHCWMPLIQFPAFGRPFLLPVYWTDIVRIISEITRTISITSLPPKSMPGLQQSIHLERTRAAGDWEPTKAARTGHTASGLGRRLDNWWVFMRDVWRIIRITRKIKMIKFRLYIPL